MCILVYVSVYCVYVNVYDIHVSRHGNIMYVYVHACLYVCELCVNTVSLGGEYSVLHLVTMDILHGRIKKEC